MTRKLLKTVAIVVIALLRCSQLEVPRRMAAVFMAAAFTAAVSVAEALVTGASEATDFGLVGFSEASIPATMAAITLAITDTAPAI